MNKITDVRILLDTPTMARLQVHRGEKMHEYSIAIDNQPRRRRAFSMLYKWACQNKLEE